MNDDTNLYVLSKLNAAISTDLKQVSHQVASLRELVAKARGIPGIDTDELSKEWSLLETEFATCANLGQELRKSVAEGKCTKDGGCKQNWEELAKHDQALESIFDTILDKGSKIVTGDSKLIWQDIWKAIYLKLNLVRAQATLAQTQMEMRARYGQHEVTDQLSEEIAGLMPKDGDLSSAQSYAQEYRDAYDNIHERNEKFGGFFDVFKSLLMIQQDAPEDLAIKRLERLRK